jgi:2-polyprenyl-6-methoxyphenol hydroxylase-like FAD-dependent oxidoreductase
VSGVCGWRWRAPGSIWSGKLRCCCLGGAIAWWAVHVLISGASVAGPALAHWLTRFGIEASVVERAPELRRGGQAIDIRGVAKEVVRRMGLDSQVRCACTHTLGASTVTRNNWRIASTRADEFDGDGYITEIEILRGDLSQVLYAATKDTTEYLFGDRIEALDQHADGVTVRFVGGDERRFDVVIGADGLHSGVRALAFGPEAQFVRHLGHYASFFTVPNVLGLDRWALSYSEPGRGAGVRTIHDNADLMAFLSFRCGPLDYDHHDVNAQKAILRQRFAGGGWWIPWLVDQLAAAPDFYFDAIAQVQLDRWSAGRVALLGDAAFCPSPLSGQGTSLAIVGAYVLAGELARRPTDPPAALGAYECAMRGFVAANQRIGQLRAEQVTPPTRLGVVRQQLTEFVRARLPLGRPAWPDEFGQAINGIQLPDYTEFVQPAPK